MKFLKPFQALTWTCQGK